MLNDASDRVYPDLDLAELFAEYQKEQDVIKKEIQRQKDLRAAANANPANTEGEQPTVVEEQKEEEVKEPPVKRAKIDENNEVATAPAVN